MIEIHFRHRENFFLLEGKRCYMLCYPMMGEFDIKNMRPANA